MTFFVIFLGAGLGGVMRYSLSLATKSYAFPLATFSVNILGSFLMGVVMAWAMPRGASTETLRLFLTTGVMGGFTTFSAFSYEAVTLYQKGEVTTAVIYVLGSVILSFIALILGLKLGQNL